MSHIITQSFSSHSQSFSVILMHSLPKVRREQEAWAAAQPWVEALKAAGFKTIRSLGDGLAMLDKLESVGLPAPLAGKMMEMRETLIQQKQRMNKAQIAQDYKNQRNDASAFLKSQRIDAAKAAKGMLERAMGAGAATGMSPSMAWSSSISCPASL